MSEVSWCLDLDLDLDLLWFRVARRSPRTGSGSGCTVNVTSNNQDGTITGLVIEGAGTGYAVGDRIKIVNKHEGLILQLTSQSSWGADGSRTPGVYTVTPTASMTSANDPQIRSK